MSAGDESALAQACFAAGDGRLRQGAALKFFWGPMDCGKSTMALQMNYNHARQGRRGLVLTRIDRSLGPQITTRIGLAHEAIEVTDDLDLCELVKGRWADGDRLDYLICDEACFYTVRHVEQMAELVDCYDVDVFAFGLASDFRSCLFPAAQRLFELADEVSRIQVEVLCWCGRPGQLNARVVGGAVARHGEQVVIGDTVEAAEVRYQVLCRRHFRSGDLGDNR
ncbi:thymidine kinase [Plantactinospora mayteni]|uniref:thymidine kinase n=1 Tax=Plantactinospora mayteni TaxID=566021 RepID=UPI003558100D